MVSHLLYSGYTETDTDNKGLMWFVKEKQTGAALYKADMQYTSAEMIHLLRRHFTETREKQTMALKTYICFIRPVMLVNPF